MRTARVKGHRATIGTAIQTAIQTAVTTAIACGWPAAAFAQDAGSTPSAALPAVVVTGKGFEQRAFDTPYSIGIVEADAIRFGGPMVNLSESMARVPGITVANRNNYAQDLQVSIRGFGARSAFGVRGLRVIVDGIPATLPDGQAQVSHIDLASAERIEVLRGPFSALHGSSSGGVILLTSAAPSGRAWRADADAGSDGLRQWRLGAEAPLGGGWDLRLQGSRFETDGPRPHSQARRDLLNLRVGWRGASDTVTLLLNSVDQPAQDPLGLSRRQWAEGGAGATTGATAAGASMRISSSSHSRYSRCTRFSSSRTLPGQR